MQLITMSIKSNAHLSISCLHKLTSSDRMLVTCVQCVIITAQCTVCTGRVWCLGTRRFCSGGVSLSESSDKNGRLFKTGHSGSFFSHKACQSPAVQRFDIRLSNKNTWMMITPCRFILMSLDCVCV